MGDTLDRIKLDLVAAFRESREVDILALSERFPDHSVELLDFWLWLTVAALPSNDDGKDSGLRAWPVSTDSIGAYELAIHNSCMAVTFGGAWLAPSVEANCEALADELALARSAPRRVSKSSLAFRKAAISSWVVMQLEPRRPQVSRLAVQKVCYLLEHAMDLKVFLDHTKKPLGPYDHKARYSDAEPIAVKQGWIRVHDSRFSLAAEYKACVRYATGYLRSVGAATRLVEALAALSDGELETLATVHWVSAEIARQDRFVTPHEVFQALKGSPEWKQKLAKQNFSEMRVVRSLAFLRALRILSLRS